MKAQIMRWLLICGALPLLLSTSSCRFLKKKAEPAPSATTPVAVTVPTPPAPAPVALPAPEPVQIADEAIATTEDFEDEAFAKISDKTYKSDLEALKKEIEEP